MSQDLPPPSLLGRTWFAQVSSGGWAAGSIGAATLVLPPGELGIAAADGWVLSAFLDVAGDNLVWRKLGDSSISKTLPVSFVPASAALSGDRAYLAGFDRETGGDPGVVSLDLMSGVLKQILPSAGLNVPRTVQISRTGATLASATCVAIDGGCDLDIVNTKDGTIRHLRNVPGYLRATGDAVAVVGPDPASWIAGIDLQDGREQWRREADEMWLGYVTTTGKLIQSSLGYAESGSVFSVDSIDLATGAAINVLTEAVTDAIGLWPEVSSDDTVAIGPGFSIGDALLDARGSAVSADLYRLDSSVRLPMSLWVGGDR